jgi:anti-sigma B factor antagonist
MIHSGVMKVDARGSLEIPVLAPSGRIILGESTRILQTAIGEAIDRGARHLIVNGSRIDYLDSTGIGELVAAVRRLMESGGKVGIAAPSPKLREILEITHLDNVFLVRESEDALTAELSSVH